MGSFERIGLVLICTVAAVASAAVVLSIDHAPASIDPASETEGLETAAAPQDSAGLAHDKRHDQLHEKLQGRLPVMTEEDAAPVETAALDADQAFSTIVEPVSLTSENEPTENPDDMSADAAQWSAKVVDPPQPAVPRATAIDLQLKVLPPVTATPQPSAPQLSEPSQAAPKRTYTLDERLGLIKPAAKQRLAAKLASANFNGQPADIGLVAIKDEKVLELHVKSASGEWQFVHRYPVLAASGATGPKLKQGDKQVPEGVYGITLLNPNSKYHVSMRVDYPNAFDREMAAKDGRKDLGGDIMIHGKAVSIGCLAIGDEAAEELFVLAHDVGLKHIKLVIAPTDMRKGGIPAIAAGQPKWLPKLYGEVATAMAPFKAPPAGLLSLLGL